MLKEDVGGGYWRRMLMERETFFEKNFFFKISTENFEKYFMPGIWFFWSQTSRFEPKINLELKNVNKVGAAHLFWYPLA